MADDLQIILFQQGPHHWRAFSPTNPHLGAFGALGPQAALEGWLLLYNSPDRDIDGELAATVKAWKSIQHDMDNWPPDVEWESLNG